MTPDEIKTLCQFIKAASPAQHFDDYTPDAWAEILPPSYTMAECRAAAARVKRRQAYVDVSDIITEVRNARPTGEPIGQLTDPAAYRKMMAAADARTVALIEARAGKTLAIEGPSGPRRAAALRREHAAKPQPRRPWQRSPQEIARHQAAESRAARDAAGSRGPAADPYVRATGGDRGREHCDCACHWHRGVREAVPCCPSRGQRYVAAAGIYSPWPEGRASQ